jgi:hypothetical protein
MDADIRSIWLLRREEIVQLARQQADADQPCAHGFPPGSVQACTWERNYHERARELASHEV